MFDASLDKNAGQMFHQTLKLEADHFKNPSIKPRVQNKLNSRKPRF